MEHEIRPFHVTHIEVMGEHFTKYHLDNGTVIHYFSKPDTGKHHDHPFQFTSTILWGGYQEDIAHLHHSGTVRFELVNRYPGDTFTVGKDTVHKILTLPEGECWTHIHPGEWQQVPGFYDFRVDGIYHRYWNADWTKLYPHDNTTDSQCHDPGTTTGAI